MTLSPDTQTLGLQLRALLSAISLTGQRRLVVLNGNRDWALECLDQTLTGTLAEEVMHVCDGESEFSQSKHARGVLKQLGSEYSLIIWDGHGGLNPDAFGAASGMLRGGGLMYLLLPDLGDWQSTPDADYRRMCSFTSDLARCGTRFLRRFAALIKSDPGSIVIWQQPHPSLPSDSLVTQTNALNNTQPRPPIEKHSPRQDQALAMDAIHRVAKGHRKRPLIIKANRGRGKTSLLGMAAATLEKKVLITAPRKSSVANAFKHFDQALKAQTSSPAQLIFVAPEELADSVCSGDLVFVDEAAAFPVNVLEKILRRYPRIVFSTTVHGYEGTGQGFSVRFNKILSLHCPGWKQIELNEAIRWADHDPLERLVFRLLALNAEPCQDFSGSISDSTLTFSRIEQDVLLKDDALLMQVMGLLVLAHYQTTPSDLRMLLDHPDLRIFVGRQQNSVLAVALCLKEGLAAHGDIHQDIIHGIRRVKGHLIPQNLAGFTMNPAALDQRFLRIVRITVHPSLFSQGLGTRMLKEIECYAKVARDDYIGVSYGLTPELHQFWQRNHFDTVRLGYQKDAASGCHSVIAVKSVADKSKYLLSWKAYFLRHLIFGLSRYYQSIEWSLIASLLREFSPIPKPLEQADIKSIQLFCLEQRAELDCLESLEKQVFNAIGTPVFENLPVASKRLLVMRVLQHQTWKQCIAESELSGKREGMAHLRAAIKAICVC